MKTDKHNFDRRSSHLQWVYSEAYIVDGSYALKDICYSLNGQDRVILKSRIATSNLEVLAGQEVKANRSQIVTGCSQTLVLEQVSQGNRNPRTSLRTKASSGSRTT